jgi:hypothetical protein
MLAGRLCGDVFIDTALLLPLPLRDPMTGAAPDEVSCGPSLGAKGKCGGLGNEGDTFARSADWGPVGGARGLGAGACGGEFAGTGATLAATTGFCSATCAFCGIDAVLVCGAGATDGRESMRDDSV